MKRFFAIGQTLALACLISLTPARADVTSQQIRDGVACAEHAIAVTPSDSTDLTHISRFIIVGATGTLTFVTVGGETVQITATAGFIYPIKVTRIRATGTAATGIVVLY
jgi:hypothetical protein